MSLSLSLALSVSFYIYLRASPLPPTPRAAVVVWIKRTKKEHTARSLELKDAQSMMVNALTKLTPLHFRRSTLSGGGTSVPEHA